MLPTNKATQIRVLRYLERATKEADEKSEPIILGGDMNTSVSATSSVAHGLGKRFRTFLRQNKFTKADPTDTAPTWTSNCLRYSKRLDEWFLHGPKEWVDATTPTVTTVVITDPVTIPNHRSDHSPLGLLMNSKTFAKIPLASEGPQRSTHTITIVRTPISAKSRQHYKERVDASLLHTMDNSITSDQVHLLLSHIAKTGLETADKTTIQPNRNYHLPRTLARLRERTLAVVNTTRKCLEKISHALDRGELTVWTEHTAVKDILTQPQLSKHKADAHMSFEDWRTALNETLKPLRKQWEMSKKEQSRRRISGACKRLRHLLYASPKKAHRRIFEKESQRVELSGVYNKNGDVTTAPNEVIDGVHKYFAEMAKAKPFDASATPTWTQHVPAPSDDDVTQRQDMKTFSWHLFEDVVSHLSNNKAPGPDEVRNEWLKDAPEHVRRTLFRWLHRIWKGDIKAPDWFTHSHTILLYKKGDQHKVNNYRTRANTL